MVVLNANGHYDIPHLSLDVSKPRFLCDFAAHLENCPEGPNCIGPGGTSFTAHLG